MSVKSDNYQMGLSATAANNFVMSTDAAGGMKLQRGITTGGVVTPTQDILTVDTNGQVSIPSPFIPGLQMGQCELVLSGANLSLNRLNGSYIFINGTFRQIPSGGVALAVTGAPANTNLYIYASWTGSAIALSYDTVAPVVDSTYGIKVKTGGAGFTLVGFARTNNTPNWVDSQNQRFVLSWFNQKPKTINFALTSNTSIGSTSLVSLSGSLLVEFLHWAGTDVRLNVQGSANIPASGVGTFMMEFDFSATPTDPGTIIQQSGGGAYNYPFNLAYEDQSLSEGYHAASLVAKVSVAGPLIFNGSATANSTTGRCIISGSVMG